MKITMKKLYTKFWNRLKQDHGQDLVEYALVVALLALGATAGMSTLAKGLNSAFAQVNTTLAGDITT